MGICSKIHDFIVALTSSPEDEVNRITAVCALALEKGIPDKVKLQRFQEIAAKDVLLEGHYKIFLWNAQDAKKELTANEHISMYIVSAATRVIALLGYDPLSSWNRTDEQHAQMQTSCRLQRARIKWAKVEKDNLTDLLFQSLGVKGLWQTSEDLRHNFVQITGLEIDARDAWWKAHPMPENSGPNGE